MNESRSEAKLNGTFNSPSSKMAPMPDLINQKTKEKIVKETEEKSLDDIKFNEIEVPESLVKQLEYFDRDVRGFFKFSTLKDKTQFFVLYLKGAVTVDCVPEKVS